MTTLPDTSDFDLAERQPWDRQFREPSRAHAAFRIYRDLPAAQRNMESVAQQTGTSGRTIRRWAEAWDWRGRADAWDDACHHVEDVERLEAIRQMHATHRRAGRAAVLKAVQALSQVEPERMPIGAIARLLELGAKLERSTLIVSVEELQGVEAAEDDYDDPWERIARELDPHTDAEAG